MPTMAGRRDSQSWTFEWRTRANADSCISLFRMHTGQVMHACARSCYLHRDSYLQGPRHRVQTWPTCAHCCHNRSTASAATPRRLRLRAHTRSSREVMSGAERPSGANAPPPPSASMPVSGDTDCDVARRLRPLRHSHGLRCSLPLRSRARSSARPAGAGCLGRAAVQRCKLNRPRAPRLRMPRSVPWPYL
jgi:hypothetical protein